MSVENEIQELKRTLELKQAYMNVKITFGKGYKSVPEDIRKEVEANLRECALKLAAGTMPVSSEFTEQEVEVLRAVARSIISPTPKTAKAPKTEAKSTEVKENPPNPKAKGEVVEQPEYAKSDTGTNLVGKSAELLMLDSLPLEQRKLVEPGSKVTILSQRSHRFFVEDPKSNRFWVPADDIQLIS